MKKISIAAGLLLIAMPALAAVTVTTPLASLVTTARTLGASSAPLGLFSFTLGTSESETLSSVAVNIVNNGTSTAAGADLASVAVYRDANANGTLEVGTDLVAGTQTTVNVGTPTTVTTATNNTLPGTFFVTLSTGASWSGVAPADSVTVRIPASGITTSANSPTVTEISTSTISAVASTPTDTTGPKLVLAVLNGGTQIAVQHEGSEHVNMTRMVMLTFDEATNKPAINATNINSVLTLSNSHSWLDSAGHVGGANWNSDGKVLVVELPGGTPPPVSTMIDPVPTPTPPPTITPATIAVGDVVTVAGSVIKDSIGNNATGTATITQGTAVGGGHGEGDDDEEEGMPCTNNLINGRLYKLAGDANPTVYLAAACMLKPFRGAAVFHARGHKFQDIIILQSLPENTVSTDPALPAVGTLVKGSDKTVWFVETGHKRKGFASEKAFLGLGFRFNQINQIADTDLNTMSVDTTPIVTDTAHPEGAIVKCSNSNTVFQVNGTEGTPFANVDSFELRGHTFQQVATIDCGKFHYILVQAVTQ
jgi:hypothetical protein